MNEIPARAPGRKVSRKRKRRATERGVALILVLGAITIMTVLLMEFQDESSSELSAALADRDSLKAEYMARSAINLSRLLVASEPTIRNAIAPLFMMMKIRPPQIPVWEFSDRVLGAFNDSSGGKEFEALAGVDLSQGKNLGLEGGRFEALIVDEDSKINVNIAARGDAFSLVRLQHELLGLMAGEQYNPLFEGRDRDKQYTDRSAACSAIIDWADPDSDMFPCDPRTTAVASSTGAEDSFYQMLDVPYRRKNAAYDSLEELRLVRGVGDDFWATFVDPDPGNPRKRVITVWGSGAVNVNTANAQTLLAVVCAGAPPQTPLCMDPMQQSTFLMMFTMMRGFTAGAPLFGSGKDFIKTLQGQGQFGPMLIAMGVKPVQFMSVDEAAKMMSTESKVFSVYADGVVTGYRRETRVRVHAVIDFRNAPPPGMATIPGMPGASASAMPGMPPMTPPSLPAGLTAANPALAGASPDAIMGALTPSAGGTVVYFRIL